MVFEEGGDGGVVKCARTGGGVGGSGNEEGGRSRHRRGNGEEDVSGLARGDEEGGGREGLDVVGIGFDNGKGVVGYAEEELIVECSVDDAEEVRSTGLHPQFEGILPISQHTNIYVSYEHIFKLIMF